MIFRIALALLMQITPVTFTPPSATSVAEPVPPFGAVRGGTVFADLTVNSDGNVERSSLLHGSSPFSDETLRVVQSWRFLPARSQGRPIASHVGVLTIF